jgi:hypothetical protein
MLIIPEALLFSTLDVFIASCHSLEVGSSFAKPFPVSQGACRVGRSNESSWVQTCDRHLQAKRLPGGGSLHFGVQS